MCSCRHLISVNTKVQRVSKLVQGHKTHRYITGFLTQYQKFPHFTWCLGLRAYQTSNLQYVVAMTL